MRDLKVQGTLLTPALILVNKDVRNGLLAAWNLTVKDQIEYGGWIYYNHATQTYRTNQKKGDKMSVGLTPAPAYKEKGYDIVGDWHCHPGKDVASSRPSSDDIENAKAKKYFMFVLTAKNQPKHGWKPELLEQIEIVDDDPADHRVWNII